jgi:hypothetical protein
MSKSSKLRDPELEKTWRKRLRAWSVSGKTITDFCESHGLTVWTFHYWRKAIRERDSEQTLTDKVKFAPVILPEAASGTCRGLGAEEVELRFPSGIEARFGSGVPITKIGEAAQLLANQRC